MEKNIFTKKIIFFEGISSTNSKAKQLAINGVDEGAVMVAKMQKKGRGRFDRLWESPEGGLYLSTILRPKIPSDKTTLLPLVASLAVNDTIKSYELSPKIKWPNDIRVNKKKIAGILLESEIKDNRIEYVVLGIGINMNLDINHFSKELRSSATSLLIELKEAVDNQQFLKNLLSNLNDRYKQYSNEDFDKIINEWKQNSDTIGKKVKINTSTEEIIGIAYDVDQSGYLIIATESKNFKKITSGDCIYVNEL